MVSRLSLFVVFFLVLLTGHGQTSNHAWILSSTYGQFNARWGVITDIHYRRSDFGTHYDFFMVRSGLRYTTRHRIKLTLGGVRMWLPAKPEWPHAIHENRIYQEVKYVQTFSRFRLYSRLRNEQRFRELIEVDGFQGVHTRRSRIWTTFGVYIPVQHRQNPLEIMLLNDLFLHYGKSVAFCYDQYRITLGINKRINKNLAFDLGYMLGKRQILVDRYMMAHTLRLFIYSRFNFNQKG